MFAILSLITLSLGLLSARSMTFRLKAMDQKVCVYANIPPETDLTTAMLQFYFAVSDARTGEQSFADAVVQGPTGVIAHNQSKQNHAEINVRPNIFGEYSLCLAHSGTPSEKNIDIDVTLPAMPVVYANPSETDETTRKITQTVVKLQRELQDIVHTLRYIKSREMHNMTQVNTISGWVWNISIFESVLILGMSATQVIILRTLFSRRTTAKQRI